MQVLMIRHSRTPGNDARKYVGSTNQPLSDKGIQLAQEAFEVYAKEIRQPEMVYVTPLIRTQMTAKILFPDARQVVVEDLREMNFGVFEGRSADEMKDDPQYKAWLDSMCKDRCPGGEKVDEFSERVCRAFAQLICGCGAEKQISSHKKMPVQEKVSEQIHEQTPDGGNGADKPCSSDDMIVMVLHGGTIMSICEKYALPKCSFYDNFLTNCQGMMYDVTGGGDELKLINGEKIIINGGN